jgi:hypothetical protein
MAPTRRQLVKLIDEIRREDILLDQSDDTVLKRWRDDQQAVDALRDILVRSEKTNGPVNVLDIVACIQLVLTMKSYAERADRAFAEIVRLRRELKRRREEARSLLGKAVRKGRIPPANVAKIMTELTAIDGSPPPPVRSSRDGSRVRTLFVRELSAMVHEDTGGVWMDPEVAAIASIVLNCDIDPEHVRNARRR